MCWKNVFTISFLPFPFRSSYALSLVYGVCVFGKIHYDVVIVCVFFFFFAAHLMTFHHFRTILLLQPKKATTTSEQKQQTTHTKKKESINNLRCAYSPCDVVDIVRYLWPLAVKIAAVAVFNL